MRKLLLWSIMLLSIAQLAQAQQQVVVQDSITGNVTWTNDKTYLLKGFVYIVNGASLTIQPGTLIFGDKTSKGTLIAEPGGKLWAIGTPTQPIVFTSGVQSGSRDRGDWGGIVLCGRAPINQNNTLNGGTVAGGDAQIEGGPRTHYGGIYEHDNSGALSYVRVEFPGIALAPNNEINGVTFGGVGDSTRIDHVQVSYSGDDNFEWFGGSVRAKYLIGFRGLDDEWDTDFGWHGKLQFCVSLRDPNQADVSGSNGFESDNDASGHFWNPRTSAIMCNMTVVGPMADTSLFSSINPLFMRGAHLRRSTQESIYNSIVMGWPIGLLLDGDGVVNGARNDDTLQIHNCIWAGLRVGKDFLTAGLTGGNSLDASAWFKSSSFHNQALVQPADVKLLNPFSLVTPNFTPQPGSPAINAADFTNSRLQDPWFTPVTYAGAFDPNAPRWDAGWTNYDPQSTQYVGVPFAPITHIDFPTISVGTSRDSAIVVLSNGGAAPLSINRWFMTDTSIFKVVGGMQPFIIPVGGSKTITIHFAPTDTLSHNEGLTFNFENGANPVSINITGKGKQSLPAVSVYPNATKYDFAYVRVGDSATASVILTNSGTAPLHITGSTLFGADVTQFVLVSGGGAATVAPNGTATVQIRFRPTSVGDKSVSLRISHDASGGMTLLTVTGKGVVVPGQDVLQDSIVGNITLTNDRTWLVKGFVYVVNGATLNIQPGTVLFGEKATKGTIIVEPGGKIFAVGTAQHPIVFTSQLPAGQRDRGDWGGIVLCGRAPINQNNSSNGGAFAGGDAQIEGGPRTHYGGTDEHDNSGIMRYCRIEFPGVALAPNNEINGLTFGGVGDSTQIDHIQVSYSGDDNYEWFGGSVRAKYLIGFRGLDDNWDTDFGWHGALQFCVSLVDPNVADISGSNGFESDNDASGHYWNPRTSTVMSNLTVVGPMSDTGKFSTINPLFKRGAHLRRSTQESIYNTIVMGWPDGLLIDGDGAANGCKNDTLQIRNSIWAGLRTGHDFLTAALTGGNSFDAAAWFKNSEHHNQAIAQSADVKLGNPFNLTAPDFRPMSGSPAIGMGDFTNARLQDPWFTTVTYSGAFDPAAPRWDSGWSNYDPQNTDYSAKRLLSKTSINFGQVREGTTAHDSITITNNGLVPLTFVSVGLNDSSVFHLSNVGSGFTIEQGESRTVGVMFAPNTPGLRNATIHFALRDESTFDVALTGEGMTASSVNTPEAKQQIALTNVPNPFGTSTSIEYTIPTTSFVTLEVIDVTGRVIDRLVNEVQQPGPHSESLSGMNYSNGVYYCRLTVGNTTVIKSVMVSH